MLGTPKRNPQHEAVTRISDHLCRNVPKPLKTVIDLGPFGVNRVRFSAFSGPGPRVQNAAPPLRLLGADVEERLAGVKRAFQPNTERADLAGVVLLGSADGLVQSLAVLGRERPIVRHQQCRAAEQAVTGTGPAALQHREPEPSCAGIVGVLNELPEQRPPVSGILVNVRQQGLDRLDLIERTSDNSGLAPDIDCWVYVGTFVHEIILFGFR